MLLTNEQAPSLSLAYDAMDRPVSRNADAFGYNARGEVVSATVGTNSTSYAYDGIGNRLTSVARSARVPTRRTRSTKYAFAGTDVPDYDDWNLLYERSERPSEGAAELAYFPD